MKFNDSDELDQLIPNENGVEVFLVGHPTLETNDKGSSIVFTFKSANTDQIQMSTFRKTDVFNPSDNMKDTVKGANKRQMFALLGAFMTKEEQDLFKDTDFKNLKEFHATAIKFIGDKFKTVKARIMITYGNGGFIEFPLFGHVITTELRVRHVVYDPNWVNLKPVKRKQQEADVETKPDNADI